MQKYILVLQEGFLSNSSQGNSTLNFTEIKRMTMGEVIDYYSVIENSFVIPEANLQEVFQKVFQVFSPLP